MSKKKRTYGPSGSQLSDDYMDYFIRIKVPMPTFEGHNMDAETFRDMLEEQDKVANKQSASAKKRVKAADVPMSAEQFANAYADPYAKRKRKAQSDRKRIVNALIYHSQEEERWWENQQMEILRLMEDMRYEAALATWKTRKSMFLERVLKRYTQIAKENLPKAKAFAKFAWEFITSRRPQNPRNRSPASLVIIRTVQRQAIRRQTAELITLTDQLSPLLSNKPAPPKREKVKRVRKKKKAIPDGKIPIEQVFPEPDDDEEDP